MPRPPAWIDEINTVVRVLNNPCDDPWAVYIETAFEPAGELILALLTFGLDDVVRGFAKPKGLRSDRHGRRGRRSFGALPRRGGIPELGELLGSNLPGAEEAKGRRVSQGVKHLWLVDGAIQRVLFWWMIIDVTTEFFADWTSNIAEAAFCSQINLGAVLREWIGGTWSALQGWAAAQAPTIRYQKGPITTTNSTFEIQDGNWVITFAVKMTNNFTIPTDMQIRIVDLNQPGNILALSEKVDLPVGASGECVVSYDAKEGDAGRFEMRIEDGFTFVDETLQYMQQGSL